MQVGVCGGKRMQDIRSEAQELISQSFLISGVPLRRRLKYIEDRVDCKPDSSYLFLITLSVQSSL